MYDRTTHSIRVCVEPFFMEEQSSPEDGRYVWAYRIQIQNRGLEPVQLKSRRWQITDAMGRMEEVQGIGVVGEQPLLAPGEAFEYTSGAPLSTPSGIMSGAYYMVNASGESFEVEIPAFSLDSPYQPRNLN